MKRVALVAVGTTLTLALGVTAAEAAPTPVPPASLTAFPTFTYTGAGSSPTTNYLQGIKNADTADNYIIVGTTGSTNNGGIGVVYQGPVDAGSTADGAGSGTWTTMSVPASFNAVSTSIYGVNNLAGSDVQLVGTHTGPATNGKPQGPTYGFFYQGPITSASSASNWVSVQAHQTRGGITRPADETYLHSVDGSGPVVGNYDFFSEGSPAGHAFVWDPITHQQTNIRWTDAGLTHTAYGIWSNGSSRWARGHDTYTISGGIGYTPKGRTPVLTGQDGEAVGRAVLIDYDPTAKRFSHEQAYTYMNSTEFVTHFEGIYYRGNGIYQLPFTAASIKTKATVAGIALIKRNRFGRFATTATWYTFATVPAGSFATNNSTYGPVSLGVMKSNGTSAPYTALVTP